MSEIAIRFDHVSKEYRLGAIGGGTLKGDLQSFMAKIRGKEDPNLMIGAKARNGNERFLALDDISFEVHKGEALGIIGHNGAGKSTLLKLLSRVTAPSGGTISYNGRIASMLEVGTGFHPELTGRENVYMNGAILGMTKAEIDRKFDEIVAFAEMEKFIDTPVKRYSSGMYVKLAFSVAAHLDSEIMIMDEVLAVGDMAFQKKCLAKMKKAANQEGRTVLYVSHNMNTIRQLCDRCVVLDRGRVVFQGDVEQAIKLYLNNHENPALCADYSDYVRPDFIHNQPLKLLSAEFLHKEDTVFQHDEEMYLKLRWENLKDVSDVGLRIEMLNTEDVAQATYILCDMYSGKQGETASMTVKLDISLFMDATYRMVYTFFHKDEYGNGVDLDCVRGLCFEKTTVGMEKKWVWRPKFWGYLQMPEPTILELKDN